MKIFVQIASYRDPQLVPTIKNMIEKKTLLRGTIDEIEQFIVSDPNFAHEHYKKSSNVVFDVKDQLKKIGKEKTT